MQFESSALTIAIPTYGRPQELRRCVQLLRNQSSRQFHLLILDNASPMPAASALEGLLDDFPAESVRLVRNRFNIGGDANILRCFELCETEYLWVLGDDDEPLADAVETVLKAIRRNPGTLFFNFACELYPRSKESMSHTLDEFIASIDSFSNVLFTSTSVFRCQDLAPYLSFGYHLIYSMASQIVLVLYSLMAKPANCLFLKSQIVNWAVPPEGIRWSGVTQLLGLGVLLDLPLSGENRTRIARLVTSPTSLEFVTVQLLAYRRNSGDTDGAYQVFDQVYARLLLHAGRRTVRLRYWIYRCSLLWIPPAIGLALFRFIGKCAGRGQSAFDFRATFLEQCLPPRS